MNGLTRTDLEQILESLEIPKKNNREAVEDIKEAPLSEQ
jgi:hypothetical protein